MNKKINVTTKNFKLSTDLEKYIDKKFSKVLTRDEKIQTIKLKMESNPTHVGDKFTLFFEILIDNEIPIIGNFHDKDDMYKLVDQAEDLALLDLTKLHSINKSKTHKKTIKK